MKSNNKGVALFIVLAFLLIMSMSAAVFLITAYNSANVNEALYRRARALTVAEAGLNYALYKIRDDATYTGETVLAGAGIMQDLMPDIPAGSGWFLEIAVNGDKVQSIVNYPKAKVL